MRSITDIQYKMFVIAAHKYCKNNIIIRVNNLAKIKLIFNYLRLSGFSSNDVNQIFLIFIKAQKDKFRAFHAPESSQYASGYT